MIDLDTGLMVKKWDMYELVSNQRAYITETNETSYDFGNAVLNGIAYYEKNDSFIISGKIWDHIYEIKLDYENYIERI